MDWPTVDTRWWNLSLGVVATTAMAACGPTILLDEGESITDSDTDGPQTPPPDTTDPPRGNCQIHADCEPGDLCVDNVCVPEDTYYCQDGGCCYDYGYDDCCYGDCYYEECFSDEECGPAAVCSYGQCLPVQALPACDEPDLTLLPLPIEDEDPIVSLAFVDGNGDEAEDLLVGRSAGARLYLGNDNAVVDLPLPEGELVLDAVSGDFDGDGHPDLALTDGVDSITILRGDGAGAFELGSTVEVGLPITKLEAIQWDSDGALDLAGLSSAGVTTLHYGDGAGGISASATLEGDADQYSMAAGRLDEDGLDDLVVQSVERAQVFLGNDEEAVSAGGSLPESELSDPPWERHLLTRALEGQGFSDVIGRTNKAHDWLLLEAWGSSGIVQQYALDGRAEHAGVGDYDGDGVTDLVLAGDERLTLVRGGEGGESIFECQVQLLVEVSAGQLAVGDFDADGRAESVIARGAEIFWLAAE